jgi:hypothetical protein
MVPTAQSVTARQDRISGAIRNASARTGVDFTYLYHQARIESGLNPDARARTSSATGLFQFIDQSWLGVVRQHGAQHGLGWAANAIERGPGGRYSVADPAMRRAIMDLRRQPDAASAMAAEFAADNRDYLSSRLGRPVESVDLYLAHFLGPAGAARFLSAHAANPAAAAAPAFGAQARANRSIFFDRSGAPRSYDEIRTRFAAKLGDAGTRIAPVTEAPADRGTSFIPGARWHQAIVPAFEQALTVDTDAPDGASEGGGAWDENGFLRDIALRPNPEQARLAYLLLARLGA